MLCIFCIIIFKFYQLSLLESRLKILIFKSLLWSILYRLFIEEFPWSLFIHKYTIKFHEISRNMQRSIKDLMFSYPSRIQISSQKQITQFHHIIKCDVSLSIYKIWKTHKFTEETHRYTHYKYTAPTHGYSFRIFQPKSIWLLQAKRISCGVASHYLLNRNISSEPNTY